MEKKKAKWVKEIISWLLVIVGAYLLAFFITKVLIIKAVVPTESMLPTIQVNDKIIGNRLSYLFSDPKRGDIVIFKYPDDPSQNYVKRVIGLPGDVIEFENEHVYVNGTLLEEPYLDQDVITLPNDKIAYTVPDNSYFMMGDNREGSWDSRYWDITFVTKDAILGKVLFRYSPSFGKVR